MDGAARKRERKIYGRRVNSDGGASSFLRICFSFTPSCSTATTPSFPGSAGCMSATAISQITTAWAFQGWKAA